MFKAIDIGPYTEDGELSIKLLPVGDVEKTASVLGKHIPDEIALFAKSAKSSDDCVWLHIIAMTASDFYGMNRNGDFFYESDLLGMQDQTEADKNIGDYKGKPVQRYKTFLQASFYHHHKNKPDQGHPRFGRVVIAAYNHVMHRVELVVQVFRVKKIIGDITYLPDVDTCNKAINGETIAFSMGCKVPGDFCSITGVWNKGPAEYGPYLKDQMGKILPDGRRVYAINRKPRFFDISKVTIPADPNGLGVTKIANLNIIVSSAQKALDYGMTEDEKVSAIIKKSEMSKVIPDGKLIGEVADLHEAPGLEHVDEDLPNEVLDSLGNLSLGKALSNLLASGILASPKEFGTIINIRISRSPNWMKESPEIDWNGGLDTDVQKQLSKHASARSFFGHYPLSRMEKIASLSTDELNKKSEDSLPAKVWQKFNKQLPGGIAIGALLATLYAAYRKNVRSGTVDKFMALVERNPLALPALIGGTTLGASTLSALVEKKASIHKTVNKMLLATAIPYVGSSYLSEKERQGKHLNKVQRLIKDHPAAGAITANLLAFGGANAIKNSLTSKVAHLKKCASYDKIDAIENFVVQPMTSLSGSISHSMAGGSIDGYVLKKIFNRKKKNNPSLTEKKMQIEDILAQLATQSAENTEKVAAVAALSFSPEVLAIAQALSEDKEALASLISSAEDSEKTAEAEKLAEELEFQGRLFARGLIAEQTKVAYLSDQIDEEQVQKTAEALNMSLEEIMGEKVASAHEEAYEAAKNNSGAGHVEVDQNAHARPVAKAEELKGLASIAKALKKVKTLPTEQAINA